MAEPKPLTAEEMVEQWGIPIEEARFIVDIREGKVKGDTFNLGDKSEEELAAEIIAKLKKRMKKREERGGRDDDEA